MLGLFKFKWIFIIIVGFIICIECCTECSDNKTNVDAIGEIEQAIGKGNFTEARTLAAKVKDSYDLDIKKEDVYKKINRAQIGFMVNSGEVDQAYSLAQEEGCGAIFTEMFMPKLSEIYEDQGKTKTLQYLTKVEFENASDLSATSVRRYSANEKYNTEATKYNSLLEQFISYIDIAGDRVFARQLLRFAKPLVVDLPKKDGNDTGVKLSDQPQADIKKKLGL